MTRLSTDPAVQSSAENDGRVLSITEHLARRADANPPATLEGDVPPKQTWLQIYLADFARAVSEPPSIIWLG